MTHSLSDIMADRFNEEPPEFAIIKSYVKDNFDEVVAVSTRDNQIIITTRSSALAGALRPHLYKLAKLCGDGATDNRRLLIRVG